MKCLECGMEMEKGTFTRKTISVKSTVLDAPAWHCPKCKKILMWMDSKE